MKKILLLIISILLIGCGSRKTEKTKSEILDSGKSKTDSESSTTQQSQTNATVDFSEFLKHNNLVISSKGTPYSLSYNGLVFQGNADVKIKNSEKKTIYKSVYQHWDIYQNWNVYHNYNVYHHKQSESHKKTESNRPSWWLGVLILIIGFGSGFYVKSKF